MVAWNLRERKRRSSGRGSTSASPPDAMGEVGVAVSGEGKFMDQQLSRILQKWAVDTGLKMDLGKLPT
ncbi:hypothetical protein ABZP36_007370 [Zizania latifolia]